MSGNATKKWFTAIGETLIKQVMTTTFNKGARKMYIENFEVIPSGVNKAVLCTLFNASCDEGVHMDMDSDGDLVIVNETMPCEEDFCFER